MIIPKEISDKIKYLCSKISEVEWSGILFYSVEGSIEDFENVKLKVEDIYLMDKGSKAYTEFELDEDLIDYRMSNPKSLSWKMGLIHSHNSMDTFFSGTDMDELNETSEFHNYYLSLIVNNFMDFTAKVAFRGKTNGFTCKNEKGEDWELNLTTEKEVMFTFETDIQTEEEDLGVEKSFSERVSHIIKKADEKAEKAKKVKTKGNTPMGRSLFNPPYETNMYNKRHLTTPNLKTSSPRTVYTGKSDEGTPEGFARYILRMGNNNIPNDTLDRALEDTLMSDLSVNYISNSIMEQYPTYFEDYWKLFGSMGTDMESFIEVTEDVILELEEYEAVYPFIDAITTALGRLLAKLTLV